MQAHFPLAVLQDQPARLWNFKSIPFQGPSFLPFFLHILEVSPAESLHSLFSPKCPNYDCPANPSLNLEHEKPGTLKVLWPKVSLCDLSGDYLGGEAVRTSTCHQGDAPLLGLTLSKHNPEAWLHTQGTRNCSAFATNHLRLLLCH